jgi:hypothetical protein
VKGFAVAPISSLGGAVPVQLRRSSNSQAPPAAPDPFFRSLRVRRRVFAALVLALAAFGFTSVRARAQVENVAKHDSDFTCYTVAGAAILAGQDPYVVTNPRGWHYLYPPLFAIMVAPLDRLHPQLQALVWFFASVVLAFGCYFECARLASFILHSDPIKTTLREPPSWLSFTPFLSIFLFGITCLELGQVSIALLYLLLLGLRLVLCGRSALAWAGGGLVLAGAVALKVVPALPAGLLLAALVVRPRGVTLPRLRWWRTFAMTGGLAAGVLAFFFLLPALLVGWRTNLRHLDSLTNRVLFNPNLGVVAHINITGPGNQSFRYAARNLGNWVVSGGTLVPKVTEIPLPEEGTPSDAPPARAAIRGVLGLGLLALLAAGWRLARSGGTLELAVFFSLACAEILVLSPISWSHGFVMLLPAVLFVPWWFYRQGRQRLALAIAAIPIALELQHYLLRSTLRLVGVLGVGTALWTVAVCALIVILPTALSARQTSDAVVAGT